MYQVKEIFFTLQGEGYHSGRAAVFLRFTGCNLWSGREEDRHRSICQFCDTDFVGTDGTGGGKYATARELAAIVAETWHLGVDSFQASPFVVCTGGEPLLQLDDELVDALHASDFTVAVETNGTQPVPAGIDWVCCSPKAGSEVVLQSGDELKLVYPQEGMLPSDVDNMQFDHFFLQPMDGPNILENTAKSIEFCQRNPRWRLSTQVHKAVGIR